MERLKPQVGILSLGLVVCVVGIAQAATHKAAAAQSWDEGSRVLAFCVWGAILIATYYLAKSKQRNPAGWVVLAMFTFIVPLIVLAFMPRGNYAAPAKIAKAQQTKHESAIAQKLADIQSGHLTPFIPQGVMPRNGEQFFWEQRCQYGQTQKRATHRGQNPALYVPLGHGLKVRVGGYQGASQNVTDFAWGPMGTVYVSNQRILFKADTNDIANAPFSEINTYDTHPEGLSVNVSGIGVMQFKSGDECLGAVFLKMVQAPPKTELTTT